jgi:hypothetical protein
VFAGKLQHSSERCLDASKSRTSISPNKIKEDHFLIRNTLWNGETAGVFYFPDQLSNFPGESGVRYLYSIN